MMTSATNAELMMRNACCSLSGPFPKMHMMATVPKFQTDKAKVMWSIGTL